MVSKQGRRYLGSSFWEHVPFARRCSGERCSQHGLVGIQNKGEGQWVESDIEEHRGGCWMIVLASRLLL